MRDCKPGEDLDRRWMRLSFERAGQGDEHAYEKAAFVQREIGERLLAHLEPVRIHPERILDVGSGTGGDSRRLRRQYPAALIVEADIALPLLQRARGKTGRWFSKQRYTGADLLQLPFAARCFDVAFSNITLAWIDTPAVAFSELIRVLKPGALLAFSTFGPDTLRELRDSWRGVDHFAHVHTFQDMHDIGDMLLRAGFHDVVLDTELLTAEYDDAMQLMRDLKTLGARNNSQRRPPGLTSRARLESVRQAYERYRRADKVTATYEVIYAHAWAPDMRTQVAVPAPQLLR